MFAGAHFMEKSIEFPSLFNRLNLIALRHWTHEQLVSNAYYHVKDLGLDDDSAVKDGPSHKENVAHLLANIHLAVRIKENNQFYQ